MPACIPTRTQNVPSDSSPPNRGRPSHGPPPRGRRRFRIPGADLSASITVFLIAVPMSLGLAVAIGAPSKPDCSQRPSEASSPDCSAGPLSRSAAPQPG